MGVRGWRDLGVLSTHTLSINEGVSSSPCPLKRQSGLQAPSHTQGVPSPGSWATLPSQKEFPQAGQVRLVEVINAVGQRTKERGRWIWEEALQNVGRLTPGATPCMPWCWHKPGPPTHPAQRARWELSSSLAVCHGLCINKRGQRTTTLWLYWAEHLVSKKQIKPTF